MGLSGVKAPRETVRVLAQQGQTGDGVSKRGGRGREGVGYRGACWLFGAMEGGRLSWSSADHVLKFRALSLSKVFQESGCRKFR